MFYPNKSLDKSPPGAISRGRRHQRGLLRGDFAQRHRTARPLGAGRRVASLGSRNGMGVENHRKIMEKL